MVSADFFIGCHSFYILAVGHKPNTRNSYCKQVVLNDFVEGELLYIFLIAGEV